MNDYKSASIAGSSTKKPALKKNVGVYPFFAIEDKYTKGGRKATDAEWKLLARYEKTRQLVDQTGIDEEYLKRPG